MKRGFWKCALLLGMSLLAAGPAAGLSAMVQAPVMPELQIYMNVRTVIDESPEELTQIYPELEKSVTFSDDQSEVPSILQKVGANVAAFFQYFPNTASVEEVRQDVLSSDGRVMKRTRGKYNYLMLAGKGGSIGLDEYRSDPRGNETAPQGPAGGFMLTTRCLWHLIHFYPGYQADSRFRYLGLSSNPKAYVIAFAQRPEAAREVARVGVWDPDLADQKVLMLIQGIVWVDPDTYQIIRAHTELLAPRNDIGLSRNTTEIECAETQFEGVSRSFWLPREALVTSIFRNYTYKNRHRYSDYRLFTVETQDKVNPPVQPKPPGR
jgi:hypothetical protein